MNPAVEIPWTRPTEGLPLAAPTSPQWAALALENLDALLVDHAHCEQKAASMAMALVGRFPEHPGLARGMIAVAQEEMRHFRQVLDRIEERGGKLTKPGPDHYVRELRDWGFRHRGGIGPLGDLLLVCAFVEARSCERFRLLSEALFSGPHPDQESLGRFYLGLADAEARHWELFAGLAREAAPPSLVENRLREMGEAEAEIVARRKLEPKMH